MVFSSQLRFLHFPNLQPFLALTCTNTPKVIQMRVDVHPKVTLIALEVERPRQHINIVLRRHNTVAARDIVLRADMSVAQKRRRKFRHGIRLVRYAERLAVGSRSQVLRDARETDLGRAISIQIDGEAVFAQYGRCKGCKGAAERVAGGDDLVVWVLGASLGHGREHAGLCFEPGAPEASRAGTSGADCGGDDGEGKVGDPVADGARAAKRDDDEFVGAVGCYEAGDVGANRVFKLSECVGVCGLDSGTIALGT